MKSFYYTCPVVKNLRFQKKRLPPLGCGVFLTLLLLNGCSVSKVLVGSVSAVDQKAESIQVTPVETIDSHWKRIEVASNGNNTDAPDRAWQSTKTAAVISLNSACRQSDDEVQAASEMGLKEITSDLLNQWREIENKTERDLQFSGFPSFETTAEGIYYDRKRKFQILVVKTPTCIYDLIFLSPPKSFTQDLATFQKFRDKLVLK